MNWNRGLQGLFGGLSSGINDFLANRESQAEQANRAKLTQLQEQEEIRLAQAQEFEKLKAAYASANPDMDIDPAMAQKFAGQFPLVKSPTGTFRRPFTVSEQADSAQRRLAELGITDKERQQEALVMMQNDPNLMNASSDVLSRFMVSRGLSDQITPSMDEVAARARAQSAGQIDLANINNAADLQRTGMTTAAQKYSADKMAQGREVTADLRGDSNFVGWKRQYLESSPQAMREYNQVIRERGAQVAEQALMEMYKRVFQQPQ